MKADEGSDPILDLAPLDMSAWMFEGDDYQNLVCW